MFAKYSPFVQSQTMLSLYAFGKVRNNECLICFVLVPAPLLSDAVMEPVTRPAPPQVNLPVSAETPADPASQAASVQATLLALLSQASNFSMADGQ